ncbi:macrolide family glycosyltransferase [Pseudobacteroides cellulosolvens]|uniref:Glycosyltransferase, MGT family n=1 Tax=Pseudobacteroides cellulosolvens ATCC 35603 = DSM 2933 TaxID=398512 RepID=A0A0L6JU27_9FIRM|nr:macrolide family glycosyltransferase [Pseudobacteroides cellulosolvens]KNY29318.1 glycosyltransferase, MGT family [Pseudobacteroides cellulosolvens ATCC 35603 = DSM 2933]
MAKVLFVNGNVHGHINPTLPVVRELVNNGEEVCYFSTMEFKQKIEAAGARFVDYGSRMYEFFQRFKPSGDHPFYTLIEFMLEMDRTAVPIVIEKTKGEAYDYIIHDSMFGAGNVLSKLLNIPAICSCTSFAMNRIPLPSHMFQPGFNPQLDNIYTKLKDTVADWGVEKLDIMDIFFKKETLNIVYTSKMFQPEWETFDDSFRFVGPSIAEREDRLDFRLEDVGNKPVIYISMGTIINQCMDFYKKSIEAFKGENCMVIMSVGNKTDIGLLGEIPDNFVVRNHVPQLEVLKSADVIICHGGLNSVSEALYYGVPVISIPQVNDQYMVSRQLVKLGAGLELKMEDITYKVLKNSVKTVLSDTSYKASSSKIGRSFVEAGGYKAAAKHILDFIKQI